MQGSFCPHPLSLQEACQVLLGTGKASNTTPQGDVIGNLSVIK